MLFTNTTSFLLLNQAFSLDALSKGVSAPMIGLILSTYPFGNVWASFKIANNVQDYGKKNLLVKASKMLAFVYFLFSIDRFVYNKTLFVIIAFIARTL